MTGKTQGTQKDLKNWKIYVLLASLSIQLLLSGDTWPLVSARNWLHSFSFFLSLDHFLYKALPSWNLIISVCMELYVAMILTLFAPWPDISLAHGNLTTSGSLCSSSEGRIWYSFRVSSYWEWKSPHTNIILSFLDSRVAGGFGEALPKKGEWP